MTQEYSEVEAGMTSYCPIEHGHLAYDVTGTGPPLILIHGSLLDRDLWSPQVDAFAREHQVIRYDARGHGMSRSAVAPYAHERDLFALFEQLGIERATLVGLSMGARIALQFSLTWPDRVHALVLAGSGMDRYTYQPEIHVCRRAMATALANGNIDGAIDAFLALWVVGPGRTADQLDPTVLASVRQMAYRALIQPSLDGCEAAFDPPIRGRLSTIQAPTLILVGEHDLPDMQRIAALMGSQIPRSELVEVSTAGHLANVEQPAVFNDTVLAFLGRHQPS